MTKRLEWFAIALAAFGLAACQKPTQTLPEEAAVAPAPTETATTSGIATQPETRPGAPLTPQQAALAALGQKSTVYFEFDSSEIRAEYLPVVASHATYLVKYPGARVRLEGHTDERGSREYNIGLGERRAQTVRRALLAQGVADAQITTVSYGEERPAVEGFDEAAHAQNRRVEFVHAP
jgi:peptidoglycan-associated lipoprotein